MKGDEESETGEPSTALPHPLTTQRLTLRAGTADDVEATWRYRRLPEVAEWVTQLPADIEAYRRTFTDRDRLAAAVIVEHDGVVIGDFMLRVEDAWAQEEVGEQARGTQAEVGWTLDPDHTGRGYATEAASALIDHAFHTLGVRRVVATCFAANTASVRLIERLGMRLEEHAVRESLHRSRGWLDTSRYALLAEEWPVSRRRNPLTLCVLLWSHPGEEEGLSAYEDEVLRLLAEHGAVVVSRVRRKDAGDAPLEVQVIEFPDQAALDAYLSDPRRLASADLRERVVARTDVFEVDAR